MHRFVAVLLYLYNLERNCIYTRHVHHCGQANGFPMIAVSGIAGAAVVLLACVRAGGGVAARLPPDAPGTWTERTSRGDRKSRPTLRKYSAAVLLRRKIPCMEPWPQQCGARSCVVPIHSHARIYTSVNNKWMIIPELQIISL